MSWLRSLRLVLRRMRYRPADLPGLFATAPGRRRLRMAMLWLAWYPLRPAAWLWRRTGARRLRLVAVTGSFGKSSTARALLAATGQDPDRLPSNYRSHLALALLGRRGGEPPLVLEAGISRPGQMRPYARMLRPDITVLTAVGSEHLTSLGTLEVTRREKGELVRGLRRGGVAVLNGDDPRVSSLRPPPGVRVVRFGLGRDNDLRAEEIEVDGCAGTRFRLVGPGFARLVRVRLLGTAMVRSLLAAAAAALELGIPLDELVARLEALPPSPGRLQPLEVRPGVWVIRDDYKSSIETFDGALDLVASLPGRRVALIGSVTEPPSPQHAVYRELGRRFGGAVDRILYLGHLRRNFISGARSGGLERAAITACASLHEALAILDRELRPGDVLLIKGRATEKLERAVAHLSGRIVGCRLEACHAVALSCSDCPMLEPGWRGRRPVT